MNTPYEPVPPPQEPPPGPPEPPITATGNPSTEERQWAMFAHLSALIGGFITGVWMGWGCFIGPLIIWLIKKDSLPFVADQAKEALNFNITLAIVGLALLLLSIVTLGIGLLITIPAAVVVGVYWLVCTIVAAVKANEGVLYRYPWTLRLIK
jgi:uncharacterized Tic20 family protein